MRRTFLVITFWQICRFVNVELSGSHLASKLLILWAEVLFYQKFFPLPRSFRPLPVPTPISTVSFINFHETIKLSSNALLMVQSYVPSQNFSIILTTSDKCRVQSKSDLSESVYLFAHSTSDNIWQIFNKFITEAYPLRYW